MSLQEAGYWSRRLPRSFTTQTASQAIEQRRAAEVRLAELRNINRRRRRVAYRWLKEYEAWKQIRGLHIRVPKLKDADGLSDAPAAIRCVVEAYGHLDRYSWGVITSEARQHDIVRDRQALMWIVFTYCKYNHYRISDYFNRDRSSVYHALNRVERDRARYDHVIRPVCAYLGVR